jgi:hypothetical protein
MIFKGFRFLEKKLKWFSVFPVLIKITTLVFSNGSQKPVFKIKKNQNIFLIGFEIN